MKEFPPNINPQLYNLTADLTDSDIDVLKAFVAGLKANRNKD